MPTVLVADDYDDARDLLQLVLERAGFHVVTARDGLEALKKAHEHHPAVALLDLFMPMQDGIETARQLKADPVLRYMPLIAFTANAHSLGDDFPMFAAVLSKPCPPDRLISAVQTAVGLSNVG
jgi:chemosensory pili system protein ChpA (sensor histidine kinase/response regulator)